MVVPDMPCRLGFDGFGEDTCMYDHIKPQKSTSGRSNGSKASPIPFKSLSFSSALEALSSGSFGSFSKKAEIVKKIAPIAQRNHFTQEIEAFAKLCQNCPQSIYLSQQGHIHCTALEILPELGVSLADRVASCNGKLSLQSTILVAEQVLKLIEGLHCKGLVHRDISPENFMFGCGDRLHHLHLTDFSFSKTYWVRSSSDSKGSHIPLNVGCSHEGNPHYMSLNGHLGLEQSRRDDLESIGYMLLQMLTGSLPWSSLEPEKEDYVSMITLMKQTTPFSVLCRGVPCEFEQYMEYCRELEFAERPNYDELFDLMDACLPAEVMEYDFEWFDEDDGSTDHPQHHGFIEPLDRRARHHGFTEPLNPRGPVQPDDLLRKPKHESLVANMIGLIRRKSFSKSVPKAKVVPL